jgi:hypothetical protein
MTKPMIRIHNSETGEVVDREMNDKEFSAYEADQLAIVAAQLEADTKAKAKADLLTKLGITAEEAAILIG